MMMRCLAAYLVGNLIGVLLVVLWAFLVVARGHNYE